MADHIPMQIYVRIQISPVYKTKRHTKQSSIHTVLKKCHTVPYDQSTANVHQSKSHKHITKLLESSEGKRDKNIITIDGRNLAQTNICRKNNTYSHCDLQRNWDCQHVLEVVGMIKKPLKAAENQKLFLNCPGKTESDHAQKELW
jgi:hypothetical protein